MLPVKISVMILCLTDDSTEKNNGHGKAEKIPNDSGYHNITIENSDKGNNQKRVLLGSKFVEYLPENKRKDFFLAVNLLNIYLRKRT